MPAQPIPDGYHNVTPYIIVKGCADALDFYKKAFDAEEVMRLDMPGGVIGHAEIRIGDSIVMMADEHPQMNALAPGHYGGSPQHLMIYTEDCDAMFKKALEQGAVEERPMADQFYGDRSGMLKDPFGHQWNIATHKEDLTPEEIDRRMTEMMKQSPGPDEGAAS